jgi:hypothetical protein
LTRSSRRAARIAGEASLGFGSVITRSQSSSGTRSVPKARPWRRASAPVGGDVHGDAVEQV